jgi:hypothetical protein
MVRDFFRRTAAAQSIPNTEQQMEQTENQISLLFMDLTLIGPPETDAEGNMRGFSINSAPDDPELTLVQLGLAGAILTPIVFDRWRKILKQRRNPRLARKLNSEFGHRQRHEHRKDCLWLKL